MQDAGKQFDSMIYVEAGHAFFNDSGERYHAESARDAWTRAPQLSPKPSRNVR